MNSKNVMKTLKKIPQYAGRVLTIVALFYIIKKFLGLQPEIKSFELTQIRFLYFLFFIVIHFLTLFLVAYGWKITLDFTTGNAIPFKDLLPTFFQSNAAKYLPGSVFEFLMRNVLGSRQGWKHSDILYSTILEAVLAVLIFAICLAALAVFGKIPENALPIISNFNIRNNSLLLFYSTIVGALLIGYLFFVSINKNNYLKSKIKDIFSISFLKMFFKFFIVDLILLSSAALCFIWIGRLIFNFDFILSEWTTISTAFLIAYFSGYIVPGSPGGLGVRESVLVLLMGPRYGANAILLTAFAYRGVSIVGDCTGLFAGWLLSKKSLPHSGETP